MKKNFDNLYEKLGGTYREKNGHLIPDIKLPEQSDYQIGKYGRIHLDYIKQHRRGRYTTLLTESKLNSRLHEIDLEAKEMFERITPEQAGLSSKTILTFLKKLEKRGSRTHGFLMMKEGKIFTEAYWKPFNQDFNHRMYSQTKSFVGVAIGLLIEEGKLSLDDKVVDYFPEKIEIEVPNDFDYTRKQTIQIVKSSVRGVTFPKTALRIKDGVQGVFVVTGNMVEFRKVEIIETTDSQYLSAIKSRADDPNSEFLTKHDRVITEGKDLYVGKILD